MLDWEKIKREVDFEQYFLSKFGEAYTFDKYKMAYVQRNSDGRNGDIIRFFAHRNTGVQMYYSLLHHDSGDIIQFIKKRVLNISGDNSKEVNEELENFLGSAAAFQRKFSQGQTHNLKSAAKPTFKFSGRVGEGIINYHNYFENYRKISRKTIDSECFIGVIISYETETLSTLGFLIKNIDGTVVGVNRIQTKEGEYFNKKWFESGTDNSLGFTFSNKPEKTETLSISESIFDAMAFYELYGGDNIQFIASNGELSFTKAALIVTYFRREKFSKLLLCCDNDASGRIFNLSVILNLLPNFKNVKRFGDYIKVDIVSEKEWDIKFRIFIQFFKNIGKQELPQNPKDNALFIISDNVSDGSINLALIFPNTRQSVQFFVSLLHEVWNLEQTIEIKIPQNKDFNEDLINKKNNHGEESR